MTRTILAHSIGATSRPCWPRTFLCVAHKYSGGCTISEQFRYLHNRPGLIGMDSPSVPLRPVLCPEAFVPPSHTLYKWDVGRCGAMGRHAFSSLTGLLSSAGYR